jgi:ABC-type transport system involved in cytochrome bd biosynthesis fused ATPase/permease subunit
MSKKQRIVLLILQWLACITNIVIAIVFKPTLVSVIIAWVIIALMFLMNMMYDAVVQQYLKDSREMYNSLFEQHLKVLNDYAELMYKEQEEKSHERND